MEKVDSKNIMSDRTIALRQAVSYLDQHVVDFEPIIFPP